MRQSGSGPVAQDHEMLAAAFEATGAGLCFLDADGAILRINPALCAMLGYERDDLLARTWSAIAPPHVAALGAGFFSSLPDDASRFTGEWSIARKDGSSLDVLVSIRALVLRDGARRILVTFTDRDERQAAEEAALRRSRDLYREVVEHVGEAIVVLQDTRLIYANPHAVALSGRAHDTLLRLPISALIHPEDLAHVLDLYQRRMAGTPPLERHAHFRMVRKSGEVLWLESSAVRIEWEGRPAMLAFLSDQSERRRQELALIKSEEHHRQVVDNVTECIFVVQDGRIVFANPRLFQLTGYAQDELFELPFMEAIHPEDRQLVVERHLRRLRGEAVEQYYQFRIVNKQSASIIWVQLSAVMIEWEGQPATLSFMTDITERKRLEDSLKQSTAERIRLETLQIQAELKEAELARRHAEDSTRAKSMFLANMSHEIRTPMNAIIGMAHLALGTELDAKQREYIEKIHGAGMSLLGIINDILDFSKIEAGRLDMEHVPFSLDEVFARVAAVTAVSAHQKGIEYVVQCPLDVPRTLAGDPLRLGQVLINLVNNAIKFTERGEVQVACRCLQSGAARVQLQFIVRDTGIGMSADQTQRLFQPFSQADESTTRKYGGTGLGLSIAKRLVELMDGAIWLDSAPGAGTTIRFTAWFGLAPGACAAPVLPQQLHGARVLLVDDHAITRAALAEGLSGLPLEIEQAESAAQALHKIRQADAATPYALVLTDLQMPDMDGLDLLAAVRCDATLHAPPRLLLLVPDNGSEALRARVERAAPHAWLSKPAHACAVLHTLQQLYVAAPGATAAATAPEKPNKKLRFRNLVALLVEDNEINQQVAGEMLRAAGVQVDVAANGRIALAMLDAAPQRYGLVLMDVQMPEMDGHEATRRMRADPRFAALPVVAMTAHAMAEERERCFASGMNAHLAKPVNPALLYGTVARWCPHSLATAQEPAVPAPAAEALEIEGVDVQDGLKRALGDGDFYRQMLGRFRHTHQDAASAIRAALEHDREQAARLAHSLRGVAALLGATPLHSLCGALESAISQGSERQALRPLLEELDATLQGLHQAIDLALTEPRADGSQAGLMERHD